MAFFTHSPQVFLPLPTHLIATTITFVQIDTQSSTLFYDPNVQTIRLSVELYSLLGAQSMADVVRGGRLRWFGHLEHKSVDDWVSICTNVMVVAMRCVGRGRKTWGECVFKLQPKLFHVIFYTLPKSSCLCPHISSPSNLSSR